MFNIRKWNVFLFVYFTWLKVIQTTVLKTCKTSSEPTSQPKKKKSKIRGQSLSYRLRPLMGPLVYYTYTVKLPSSQYKQFLYLFLLSVLLLFLFLLLLLLLLFRTVQAKNTQSINFPILLLQQIARQLVFPPILFYLFFYF